MVFLNRLCILHIIWLCNFWSLYDYGWFLGRENFMGVSQRSRPPKISTTCFCLIYFSKIWHFEIHEYPLHPAILLKSNNRRPSVKLHKIYSPTKTKSNLFRHFVTLQCYSIFHSQRDCFFKFNLKCVFHTCVVCLTFE